MNSVLVMAIIFGAVGYFFGYLIGHDDGVDQYREARGKDNG